MILVFGGAYQGKTDYAVKEFGRSTVCDLSESGEPDFTKEIITGIDDFASRLTAGGENPSEYFESRRDLWEDSVLVVTDTSQGVVPMDIEVRAAREANGRLITYLAGEAEQVHRVFCGIGKRIK